MNLVIFDDALKHLLRLTRICNSPGGNVLLVGVGGSGRSSLARLASYIASMTVFSIEITKNYRLIEMRPIVLFTFKRHRELVSRPSYA